MAFFSSDMTPGALAAPDRGAQLPWLRRALAAALPFVIILAWTTAVRLPFAGAGRGDEYFFSIVANEWLHRALP